MRKTIKAAFYGKGGIGKSTIAANLSAEFGRRGMRVLHIGCDPKADSVRKLTGKRIPTVLGQINDLGDRLRREDIVFPGAYGVSCIEAGGPEAGMGCAGMGLTSMSAELERLGILREEWDVVLYDVLGDVVCGGFSIPMRNHYADQVYLVTSADYMSFYAANNILKSVVRSSVGGKSVMGGLIQNHCRNEAEARLAEGFARMTRTRCVGRLWESQEILQADYRQVPVISRYPDSRAAAEFRVLADAVQCLEPGGKPKVLEEDQMEELRRLFLKMSGAWDETM